MHADAFAERRTEVVDAVVARLYAAHPEWEAKWGAAGRDSCARDIAFSFQFLESAIRTEEPAILASYGRWFQDVLAARNVPPDSVTESFVLLEEEVAARVPSVAAATSTAVRQAVAAMRAPRSGPDLTQLEATSFAFLEAILGGRRRRAEEVLLAAVAAGMDRAALADRVVQPAMEEVGRRWARNEISVAEEHLATAVAQAAIVRISPGHARASGEVARRAVFACVEGNLHALGARVVADTFEAAGWDVDFLGADVPTRDLVAYARTRPVRLVGLSVALTQQLPAAQRAIAALRRELGAACPRIIVGGIPVREFARAARTLGADAVLPTAAGVDALEP